MNEDLLQQMPVARTAKLLQGWTTPQYNERLFKLLVGADGFAESFRTCSAGGWTCLVLILAFVTIASLLPASLFAALPELPRVYMDTTYVPPTGRTIAVAAGGDFQVALDAAQPGDVITLEAGTTYTGPFRMPNKVGSGWITIRTSAPDSSLPPPGTRMTPSYANVMPKLASSRDYEAAIYTTPGAHHYRFVGIEFKPTPGTFVSTLILLGDANGGETTTAALPHDIIFDRCYVHGDPTAGTKKGFILNAQRAAVIDSYISDIKIQNDQSQGILSWNGLVVKIANNYIEAAGENVLFGGAPTLIPNFVSSDIEMCRNHFFKPTSWKTQNWAVANLLELKSARRVLIDGNIFENNWGYSQSGIHSGHAIAWTPRNGNGEELNPWSAVQDITFTNNIVRHVGQGITITGRDFPVSQGGYGMTDVTRRVLIKNNLFEDLDPVEWFSDSQLFRLFLGIEDLTIEYNTAFAVGAVILADGAPPHTGFVFRNNVMSHGSYGIFGVGVGFGSAALTTYFPGIVFAKNVLVGPWPTAGGMDPSFYSNHRGNFFPKDLDNVGFVNRIGGDYRLAASSPYKNAGKDIGVDFAALAAARAIADNLRRPTERQHSTPHR